MRKQLFLIAALSGITVHAMDEGFVVNVKVRSAEEVQKAIQDFEFHAEHGTILGAFMGEGTPRWFNGDQVKTKCVLRSLLAMPHLDWKPTEKEADLKLIAALRKGDIPAAQAAIDQNADVNCHTNQGGTPLSIAIDRLALVKLLLDNGANADMTMGSEWTPLAAATYGHDGSEDAMNIVKLLLEHGARPKMTLFGKERGASPVSSFYIPDQCAQVMQVVLSHVSAQDVASIKKGTASKEEVIEDIIETRKLLLYMSVPQGIWKFDSREPRYKALSNALSIDQFDANYRQVITQKVEALLANQ